MRNAGWRLGMLSLVAALCACAPHPPPALVAANDRPFDFARDTFAFVNELEWKYRRDPATGVVSPDGSNEASVYTKRCFVLARSARQFFQFARFDPRRPRTSEADYRRLVRAVIARDPSETGPVERLVVPGYASLRDFSRDWEPLLKRELGGWEDSEFQRGNWRMIWPFSRGHQQSGALAMAAEIAVHRPPVVHLHDFPELAINHAVLLYRVAETPTEIRFDAYDPNQNARPLRLTFARAVGRFVLEPTHYFTGGPVAVYEVYRSALY